MKHIFKLASATTMIALVSLGSITPAYAAEAQSISLNGTDLNGASDISASFSPTVTTPTGTTEVKFILDGNYLGKDTTAPYSWPIETTTGNHKLKVRSDGSKKVTTEVNFTVGSAQTTPAKPTTPPVKPPVTPTPPVSTPTTPPATGGAVTTSAQLEAALKSATPGSTITVADGTYTGDFTASAEGQVNKPITLTGSSKVILTTGNVKKGYGLHITGDYWVVKNINVTQSGKGIVLDGSEGTILDTVNVGQIGDEAVHFRKNSSNGQIINSTIHDTGLKSPSYGEGVYIGTAKSNWSSIMGSSSTPDKSDNVLVKNNNIYNTTTEGIDIKEGTTGGTVSGNTFTNSGYSGENYGDSWVDVKGNNYTITGNRGSQTLLDAFQIHQALKGWGNNNSFSNNTVTDGVKGYLVNVQSGITGTSVSCQTTLAKQGLSNIACA